MFITALSSTNSFTTSIFNFMTFDERKNFNVFKTLKDIEDDNIRSLTFLLALIPLIHQKLYDLCAPDEPTSKPYKELVALLQVYLDPRASVPALQNKFTIREQLSGE